MNDLLIGIIGAGSRLPMAANAHLPGHGSRVIAVADPNHSALEMAKNRFGHDVATSKNWRDIVNNRDINAIFVTTPDYMHEEQVIAAMQSGKSVFCEKPMATSIEGCDRMLAAAHNTRQRLFIGHNMRYMNFTSKMKEIIDRGDIGQIKAIWVRHFISYGGDAYFKDWHSERKYSNSLLLQKGSHDIDIIHWLAGGHSVKVSAFGSLCVYDRAAKRTADDGPYVRGFFPENWPPLSQRGMSQKIDVEDLNIVNMILSNGVLATYQQCHFTPDAWRNYTVIGTNGRLENYGDSSDECTINVWTNREDRFRSPDAIYRIPKTNGDHGGSDARIAREFVRFARQGGPTTASAVAARNSVATGCQAALSLRSGGIPLDIPNCDPAIVRFIESYQ